MESYSVSAERSSQSVIKGIHLTPLAEQEPSSDIRPPPDVPDIAGLPVLVRSLVVWHTTE